jgi:trigger factor
LNGRVTTQVEELPDSRVRLSVEVPAHDMKHAVEHAASDLAAAVRIPGFRKGKVPLPVLFARVGKDRVFAEAVESHIGGWFRNAAVETRIRPVELPEYDYDLPDNDRDAFRFTATVAVQPKPEPADWRSLEVPRADATVPPELVDVELERLQYIGAPLEPVEGRAAHEGDAAVIDIVSPTGEAQRDVLVELGSGRLVEELEAALPGMEPGQTKAVTYELADDTSRNVEVTLKELKERRLPPLDDALAQEVSEFATLDELRGDIETRLREQLEGEVEGAFREAAVDALVDASKVDARGPLVDARTRELLAGLERSLAGRGISLENYIAITGQDPNQLVARLQDEAARSVSRELVLEAVADRLGIQVSDDELRAFIRDQVGDDPDEEEPADAVVERIWEGPAREQLREDLRLRAALDRVAAEVKPIPVELARAREQLWTPDKGQAAADTKLWVPGSKEQP